MLPHLVLCVWLLNCDYTGVVIIKAEKSLKSFFRSVDSGFTAVAVFFHISAHNSECYLQQPELLTLCPLLDAMARHMRAAGADATNVSFVFTCRGCSSIDN